jgi:UDP-glucose 4-epimerase
MNILVTGASGFIGQRLCARLKALGHRVVALFQDLTKPFSLDNRFDIVIHLAAHNITHVGDKDEGLYTAVNVKGTEHLLKAVRTEKFIYMSTAKVYKNEGLQLTEESPVAPQGVYEQSKLRAEEMCRASLKKESLVIFRSVNCLGWGQAPKAVLPVFFQKAKANQTLDIIGPAHTPMQFVYVEDLIDAIEAAISHKNVSGIFNIAHEETFTLDELAKKIIEITPSSSVINIHESASKIPCSPVICDKAFGQLGWRAKTGLAKILELYAKEE